MFLVFNKDKIYTYVISILTVVVLLFIANIMYINKEEAIEASSNSQKLLPIYNVKTEENKVSLTMNCAWNADDIDEILKILKDNDVKITFFMVGDWVEKYPDAVKKIYDAGQEIRKS